MRQIIAHEELLPLVDENDKIIGNINRSVAHKNPQFIHRIVAIIIYSPKKEMLIHKRSMKKDVLPGYWDLSAAGHVDYGEDYLDAAKHELYEEVGITASKKNLKSLGKFLIKSYFETEFCQVYEYTLKKNDNIKISKDEIDEAKFVSMDELRMLVNDSKQNWNPKTINLLKDLKIT